MKMIQFFAGLLILGLILSSCSHPGKLVSDDAGIQRTRSRSLLTGSPDFAFYGVRDDQNKLITDKDKAEVLFEANNGEVLPSPSDIHCDTLTISQNAYKASTHYYKALESIKKEEWDQAINELEEARKDCDGITYQSSYYYLLAFIHFKRGNRELAKQAAQDFLLYSERPEPYSFSQSGDGNSESQEFKEYTDKLVNTLKHNREKAAAFLQDGSPLVFSAYEAQEKTPRMSYNHFFIRPGFTQDSPTLLPLLYYNYSHKYSDYPGSELGFALGFPLWGAYFMPKVGYKSDFEWTYGLNTRVPFYQSLQRDLNLEITGFYRSAVRGTIRRDGNGDVTGVSNRENGGDFGIGLGGTKRFWGRYNISTEVNYVDLFTRDEGKFLGTLYGNEVAPRFVQG